MVLKKSLRGPPRMIMKCYSMQLRWNSPWVSQGREVATGAVFFCLWLPSQSWHWPEELPSASLLPLTYQMTYLLSAVFLLSDNIMALISCISKPEESSITACSSLPPCMKLIHKDGWCSAPSTAWLPWWILAQL